MRWHHLAGLIFGVTAVTWIFSGMMSMNPWKVFDTPTRLDARAYAGADLGPERFQLSVAEALKSSTRTISSHAKSNCGSSAARLITWVMARWDER